MNPEWLGNVNLAAQHLARLALETAAEASLIAKGDQIWAYAGELPKSAATTLARLVGDHFRESGSDLARFLRLQETNSDYMLYATSLGGEYVLATVFDAETPFSKIRVQAGSLARSLSNQPVAPPRQEPTEASDQSIPDDFEDEIEEEELDLRPILDDVPPPIPGDWVPEQRVKAQPESLLEELLEDRHMDAFTSETVAVPRHQPEAAETAFDDEQDQVFDSELDEGDSEADTVAARVNPQAETEVSPTVFANEELDDLPKPEEEIELEPVSPSMYNLTYACVLIPRFPHHHLTGEIAQRLTDWITHLCVAFGWRLEQLSVRPEYMQWLVNVPPNTSPGYLMRTIREHTSRRMSAEFPHLQKDNLSGDFWAPGYLILGNPQPAPPALVQEFIVNTRARQGFQDEGAS